MRTELYEQYKQEHPEELTELEAVRDYNRAVEAVRGQARQAKVERVQKWKDILDRERTDGDHRK